MCWLFYLVVLTLNGRTDDVADREGRLDHEERRESSWNRFLIFSFFEKLRKFSKTFYFTIFLPILKPYFMKVSDKKFNFIFLLFFVATFNRPRAFLLQGF